LFLDFFWLHVELLHVLVVEWIIPRGIALLVSKMAGQSSLE
jgi:hypothetical protein